MNLWIGAWFACNAAGLIGLWRIRNERYPSYHYKFWPSLIGTAGSTFMLYMGGAFS